MLGCTLRSDSYYNSSYFPLGLVVSLGVDTEVTTLGLSLGGTPGELTVLNFLPGGTNMHGLTDKKNKRLTRTTILKKRHNK